MKGQPLTCEKARAVCIVKTMAKAGHFPSRETEKEAWFPSPFRSETQASFKVSKTKNLWYDHGAGFGGNVIDLVVKLYDCRFRDALLFLSDVQTSFSFHPQPPFSFLEEKLNIGRTCPIGHPGLMEYLNQRHIPLEVANEFCKEVHYTCNGKNYFAIGLKNDSGGWELRNRYFKNSSSPKDSSHIGKRRSKLVVTEGMFDLLSLVSYDPSIKTDADMLVLNSASFVGKALKTIQEYKVIELYLDNDGTGKTATNSFLLYNKNCIDKSYLYEEYKDMNQMWIGRKETEISKKLKTKINTQ